MFSPVTFVQLFNGYPVQLREILAGPWGKMCPHVLFHEFEFPAMLHRLGPAAYDPLCPLKLTPLMKWPTRIETLMMIHQGNLSTSPGQVPSFSPREQVSISGESHPLTLLNVHVE